jgi:hypothetical protein
VGAAFFGDRRRLASGGRHSVRRAKRPRTWLAHHDGFEWAKNTARWLSLAERRPAR